ncbi:hypothetical protein ACFSTC_01075 [Nonomuraea ferruginea]
MSAVEIEDGLHRTRGSGAAVHQRFSRLRLSGGVVMYVTRLRARVGGVALTFTPELPPPPAAAAVHDRHGRRGRPAPRPCGPRPGRRADAAGQLTPAAVFSGLSSRAGLSASLSHTTPAMITASQKARAGVSTSSKNTGPRSAAPTAPMLQPHTA